MSSHDVMVDRMLSLLMPSGDNLADSTADPPMVSPRRFISATSTSPLASPTAAAATSSLFPASPGDAVDRSGKPGAADGGADAVEQGLLDLLQRGPDNPAPIELLKAALVSGEPFDDFPDVATRIPIANSLKEERCRRLHTPLMIAAAAGHTDAVVLFLSLGAKVLPTDNSIPESLPTALDVAVAAGHYETTLVLLASTNLRLYRARNVRLPGNNTILHAAVLTGNVAMMRLILAADLAPVHERNDDYKTARMAATIDGDLYDAMRTAFDAHEADKREAINDERNRLPTHYPLSNLVAIARMYGSRLSSVVDFEPDDHGNLPEGAVVGDTRLITACRRGDAAAVAMLLSRSGSVFVDEGGDGLSPIAVAARGGHRDVVATLLAKRATHNHASQNQVENRNGDTVLHLAALSGSAALVDLLAAFPVFGTALAGLENAQGQIATDLLAGPARSLVTSPHLIWNAINGSTGGRACAVCLDHMFTAVTGPSSDADPDHCLAHTCAGCSAEFCAGCLHHLTVSSLKEGSEPVCPVLSCGEAIPTSALGALTGLTFDDYLLIGSLTANRADGLRTSQLFVAATETSSSAATGRVPVQVCPVCARSNAAEATSPPGLGMLSTYTCSACNVRICTTCARVAPIGADAYYEAHAACLDRAAHAKLFAEFEALLQAAALRRCPACDTSGQKDGRCTHISCSGCVRWCYVCARSGDDVEQDGIGNHGVSSTAWTTDPTRCPMYLAHLASVDKRIVAAGCGSGCTMDCAETGCKTDRDLAAQALLTTIRVRTHVLAFAQRLGIAAFTTMLDTFSFRKVIDDNFFGGAFPWDATDDALGAVTACDFEPADVRAFYAARTTWFDRLGAAVE